LLWLCDNYIYSFLSEKWQKKREIRLLLITKAIEVSIISKLFHINYNL